MGGDLLAARFQNPGHPYPYLCQAGLGHLWLGPRRNDFDPDLVAAVRQHLKKHDRPAERGDAINAIRNRILQGDWGWLEQREDEGCELRRRRQAPQAEAPVRVVPPRVSELEGKDRAAALEAIERAKKLRREA